MNIMEDFKKDKIKLVMLFIIIVLVFPFQKNTWKLPLSESEEQLIDQRCSYTLTLRDVALRHPKFSMPIIHGRHPKGNVEYFNQAYAKKHDGKFQKACKKFVIKKINSIERYSTKEYQRQARLDIITDKARAFAKIYVEKHELY